MKTFFLSLLCAAGVAVTAQAQIFRPQIANDVLIGGVAGAIIGNNNHHRTAEGALIGAAAGYLWGVATTPPAQPAYAPPVPVLAGYGYASYAEPATVCVDAPIIISAWGPRYGWSHGYGYNHSPARRMGYYGRAGYNWESHGYVGYGHGYSYRSHGYGHRR